MKQMLALLLAAVVVCVFFLSQKPKGQAGDSGEFPPATGQTDFVSSEPSSSGGQESQKDPMEGMKAVWFSYLEWNTMFKGASEEQFQQKLGTVLDNLVSIGCNTVMMHVRAFGDAMYRSSVYPWSASVSGVLGKDPGYDPLSIIVEKAHAKGIAVHAWINPMRTMTAAEFDQIGDCALKQWYAGAQRYQYYMKDSSGHYILNPANPEVRKLISAGVTELVQNYDIDGVHIDDYFYPSGVDGLPENDAQYYQEAAPGTDISSWRRDATTEMVREMHDAVKAVKPEIPFGASPQSSLTNDFDRLYIDIERWISEGLVDYLMPQIYFGFHNTSQPFDQTAAKWNELVGDKTALYVGLATYKVGLENDQHAGEGKTEWIDCFNGENNMLERQVEVLESLPNCKGYCLYSYQSIFNPDGSRNQTTEAEIDHLLEAEKKQ